MKILTKEQMLDRKFIQKTLTDYKKTIRGVDLFCGCGGFSLGFMQAGINVVCGVDNDYHALSTYWYNLCGPNSIWINQQVPKRGKKYDTSPSSFNDIPWKQRMKKAEPIKAVIQKDINDVIGDDILDAAGVDKIECVFGSPPCQSFSSAGNKRKSIGHPFDYLCFEFARIILELRPKVICMEQVPPFVKKRLPDGRFIIDVLTDILKNHDWELYYEVKYNRWWHEIGIKPLRIERIQVSIDDLPEGIISIADLR